MVFALARPDVLSSDTAIPGDRSKFVLVVMVWAEALRPEAKASASKPDLIDVRSAPFWWHVMLTSVFIIVVFSARYFFD